MQRIASDHLQTHQNKLLSKAFPDMIELMRGLKGQHGLTAAAVSNEGRELTAYRVGEFKLGTIIDFSVSSCFVHYRKPDAAMYRIALEIAQVSPERVAYTDDRAVFVEVARGLGINGIVHIGYEKTRSALENPNLKLPDRDPSKQFDHRISLAKKAGQLSKMVL